MDPWRAPGRILSSHATDQVSDFFRYPRPPDSLAAGSPSPEQAVPGAMPRDDRIGFDESECFGPVRPDPTNDHPEQAIESIQLGARCLRLYTASCCRRATASIARRCRAMRNARRYASIANRTVVITPMLVAFA